MPESQNKPRRIDELNQRLSALRNQKSVLDTEGAEWAEKRDKLDAKIRKLGLEILDLKDERDKLNAEVKELKNQRNETRPEIHERIEEMKELRSRISALQIKKPSVGAETLQRQIQGIEWKIQTTPLGLKEEKELVQRVSQLQAQLNTHINIARLNERRQELQSELKALKIRHDEYHERLTNIAQQSQAIHRGILEKIEESRKLRLEADDQHKRFLQAKDEARPFQMEIVEISNEIERLRDEIRKGEEKEKKQAQDALREKIEREAREKLKRGERLTLEEFQLLARGEPEGQD